MSRDNKLNLNKYPTKKIIIIISSFIMFILTNCSSNKEKEPKVHFFEEYPTAREICKNTTREPQFDGTIPDTIKLIFVQFSVGEIVNYSSVHSGAIPVNLKANTDDEVTIVGCIRDEPVTISETRYSFGSSPITVPNSPTLETVFTCSLLRHEYEISLINAESGKIIALRKFTGSNPTQTCPEEVGFDFNSMANYSRIFGDTPEVSEIIEGVLSELNIDTESQ